MATMVGGTPPPCVLPGSFENPHAASAAKFVSYFDPDTGEYVEFATFPYDGQELMLPDVLPNGNDTAHGASAPTSPSTDPSKCALVHNSPTSVLFFDDSEAEQKTSLSSPEFTHPGTSTSGNDVSRGACAPTCLIEGFKVLTQFAPGVCVPASPARSLKDNAKGSPTSVAFFGNSEAEQTPALPELSNSAHPKLLGLAFPSVSDSSPACELLTMPFSTFKTQISTCDVSSTYEKGSDSLCFSCAQDILLNSLSTAAFSSDLPCILGAPTFFAYWFDGFLPSQFLCALFIIFVLFIEPFDDIVPKLGLSKYLKETIYSLDLASMTAEPRAAKSYTTTHPIYRFVDLRSSSGFMFSERSRPSKMSSSGTAADLPTTSSLNSA